jgi:hypothetical protein
MAVQPQDKREQIFPSIKRRYIKALGGHKKCKELCEEFLNALAESKLKSKK